MSCVFCLYVLPFSKLNDIDDKKQLLLFSYIGPASGPVFRASPEPGNKERYGRKAWCENTLGWMTGFTVWLLQAGLWHTVSEKGPVINQGLHLIQNWTCGFLSSGNSWFL